MIFPHMENRMIEVIAVVAPGVEEIEIVATVDILRRGGIKVHMAGPVAGIITASRGVAIEVDYSIKSLFDKNNISAIILPGGMDGVTTILNNQDVLNWIKISYQNGITIAAICAAPLILEKCGILDKTNLFTSHPAIFDDFSPNIKLKYSQERVVISKSDKGTIITSRAPGTAIEFGFAILKALKGESIVETVNRGVLAQL
jgi:protein deglycase